MERDDGYRPVDPEALKTAIYGAIRPIWRKLASQARRPGPDQGDAGAAAIAEAVAARLAHYRIEAPPRPKRHSTP